MRRYGIWFWGATLVGAALSRLIVNWVKADLGIPKGRTLAGMGDWGPVFQTGSVVAPFLLGALVAGVVFGWRELRRPGFRELARFAIIAAVPVFGLAFVYLFVIGGWFAVIQGGLWALPAVLLLPGIVIFLVTGAVFAAGVAIVVALKPRGD